MINAMYKTNKYKMHLIVINRVRLSNISYYILCHLFQKRHLRFISGCLSASKISIGILTYRALMSFLPMLRTVLLRLLVQSIYFYHIFYIIGKSIKIG